MIDFCQYNCLSHMELARGLGARSSCSQDCKNCGNSSGCCCRVRLLIPFSSHHLNTNFGNTEIFHPLPSLPGSLRAAQQPRAVIFNKTDLWCSILVWDIIARDNILALSLFVIHKRHNYTWIKVSVTYVVLACFARNSNSKFKCVQSRPKAHWGNLQIFSEYLS